MGFEYKIAPLNREGQQLDEHLQEMGAQGWRLAFVIKDQLVFERPLGQRDALALPEAEDEQGS